MSLIIILNDKGGLGTKLRFKFLLTNMILDLNFMFTGLGGFENIIRISRIVDKFFFFRANFYDLVPFRNLKDTAFFITEKVSYCKCGAYLMARKPFC